MPACSAAVELERRHAGARDAVGHDLLQLAIGGGAANRAAAKVDIAHPVTIGAMTGDALRRVQLGAEDDVGHRILAGVVLRRVLGDDPLRPDPGQQGGAEHR